MKRVFILLLFLLPLLSIAQFSKTHYIPPLTSSTSVSPQEQYLYISTASTNPVKVKIIEIGGTTYNLTVSKNSPIEHYIGFGSNTQLQVSKFSSGGPLNNKGYIIEAEDMVYVTARVLAGSYNQAGALVSKGMAALGTQFRIGAFINILRTGNQTSHLTFLSILATENNTAITITAKTGITFVNPVPTNFILNRGESFIAAVDDNQLINKDGLIGALIFSNKPIAVNCGSYAGSNGEMSNIDLGFDQIVSAERTGKEYIFIKGKGMNNVEIPLIIAHEDNTEIFLNGNPGVFATLNAGEYKAINGIEYSANGNLYVRTSKNVFAYQGLGDNVRTDQANQEMFFVPPLSCETPKIIDNIPKIDYIGNRSFTGSLSLVTETGALLIIGINGTLYPITSLPAGVTANGPLNVTGNTDFVTYTLTGLKGNISVESTKQVYLSYYGSNGAASYGGFYSGFPYKPEVISDKITITTSNCIPNVNLKLNTITAYDSFQWFFNDVLIPEAT
ncbi:MAG: IgGFc-binding protein, partial [Flavobacteriaceae bacterium]|nr:IgGFc-binding protein [Flavobacteriaceae bacterium]